MRKIVRVYVLGKVTTQRRMDKDINLEIYRKLVIQPVSDREPLRKRVEELEAENLVLKAENENLRGKLIRYQLLGIR